MFDGYYIRYFFVGGVVINLDKRIDCRRLFLVLLGGFCICGRGNGRFLVNFRYVRIVLGFGVVVY